MNLKRFLAVLRRWMFARCEHCQRRFTLREVRRGFLISYSPQRLLHMVCHDIQQLAQVRVKSGMEL